MQNYIWELAKKQPCRTPWHENMHEVPATRLLYRNMTEYEDWKDPRNDMIEWIGRNNEMHKLTLTNILKNGEMKSSVLPSLYCGYPSSDQAISLSREQAIYQILLYRVSVAHALEGEYIFVAL